MTESQITFETQDGKELLFEGVHYDIDIDGLMATTKIAQHYSNPYETNIEAVYTFPMNPDAVLLGIKIKINDRTLKGTIIEKSEAEAKYEEVIDEGNRAIMVEKQSDGIYTVNIANILPSDKISVTIEYTQLLEWRQDRVKWSLPTTIAQKYGDPQKLGLDDVTDPATSLWAENRFGLDMTVKGILADSEINAPSHKINIDKYEDHTKVTLKDETDFMDKDIVFTFKTQKSREERSFALVGKDFDGYAAIASFYPSFGTDHIKVPKSVTFVIDCSGSMSGVSIDRARTALSKALILFSEKDSFNIVKFGSHHESLFDIEVPATSKNLNIAKRMIRSLDANMGGTNMEEALQSVYDGHKTNKDKAGYLFLITDGQIYDHDSVVASATKSEMGHFVVGVGYASDDPLLKKIASETRGSYENVDPNEKMDDYILNLFKKIDTPKALNVKVDWPIKAEIEHTPNVVFDGDTLYSYATFNEKPTGEATLSYTLENGNQYSSSVIIEGIMEENEPSVVSKLVIAQEIDTLNAQRPADRYYGEVEESVESQKIVQLSSKYQLFSELTNYILVDEVADDEKPVSLPEMRKVDNMIVDACMSAPSMCMSEDRSSIRKMKSVTRMSSATVCHEDILDVPFFLRKQMDEPTREDRDSFGFDDLPTDTVKIDTSDIQAIWDSISPSDYAHYLDLLNGWFEKYHRLPRRKDQLLAAGFENEIVELFVSKTLREQIKLFAIRLYQESGELNILSEDFISYIENKLLKKSGLTDSVLSYVDELW